MAELKSIKFPGLDEVYEVAQTDETLENAKATGGIGWEDTEIHKIDKKYLPEQDLSAYRTAVAQDEIDATKQDKLVAGTNITIAEDGKTISAGSVDIDNQTIIKGEDGKIRTAVGGYEEPPTVYLEWDGNTTGLSKVDATDGSVYWRVQETAIDRFDDDVKSSLVAYTHGANTVRYTSTSSVEDGYKLYFEGGYAVCSVFSIYTTIDGVTFPEVGTYIRQLSDGDYISRMYVAGAAIPIAAKFIPTRLGVDGAFVIVDGVSVMPYEASTTLEIYAADDGSYLEVNGMRVYSDKVIAIASSTQGSRKWFKITVDDSGTLSATEVTS